MMPTMEVFHEELDFISYDPEKAYEYYQESIAAEEDVTLNLYTNETC